MDGSWASWKLVMTPTSCPWFCHGRPHGRHQGLAGAFHLSLSRGTYEHLREIHCLFVIERKISSLAYNMSSIKQQSSSFLGNLERLPPEIMDRILQLSLFSESFGDGNHSVLHMVMILSQFDGFPHLRRHILGFMRTEWLRKEIRERWNLYSDFNSAYQDRQALSLDWTNCPSYATLYRRIIEKDLVSRTIAECPSCFRFLLYYRTILPSYYNQDGESLLYMTLTQGRERAARLLTRSLTIEDLGSPLWLTFEKVGPSAFDIASSEDFVMQAPWDYTEENAKRQLDYHKFMFGALKEHTQKTRIGPAYQ